MTSPHYASAAPIHERGLHSRAGNAMARTRAAVLEGATAAVEKHGARKATMADIASLAGIAKGTLYNHFRAKEAVYSAALDAGIRAIAAESGALAPDDLAGALAFAADQLGANPALRRIALDEPAVLAALVTPTDMPLWGLARSSVRDVLTAGGVATSSASVDLVVRWLTSFIAAASASADVKAQAGFLAAALRPREPVPVESVPAGWPSEDTGAGPAWHDGHQ